MRKNAKKCEKQQKKGKKRKKRKNRLEIRLAYIITQVKRSEKFEAKKEK